MKKSVLLLIITFILFGVVVIFFILTLKKSETGLQNVGVITNTTKADAESVINKLCESSSSDITISACDNHYVTVRSGYNSYEEYRAVKDGTKEKNLLQHRVFSFLGTSIYDAQGNFIAACGGGNKIFSSEEERLKRQEECTKLSASLENCILIESCFDIVKP